ncbi:MAG TPA: carboxyl transferase domain-containing protein [Alphaproteobacteria bacterium]|jgi:acetyl-CoA carboxylase carboxyltransferase component|nr:carboxyl transferase domain-containing protein [Alphaproteobacteria bacterium]
MSWQPEIDELRRREELAKRMGGPEKVARHKNAGKLTVRERVEGLVDPGSFHEVGAITGKASYDEDGRMTDFVPANLVTGRAKLDSRPVVVAGDDFTVRGGANDAGIREKLIQVEKMANGLRLPLIRLVDGTGGGGSVKNIEVDGRTYIPAVRGWEVVVDNLSTVPVVALALGSVAGLGAARVAASHYSVMVKETSQMFVAGPPVVARIGQQMEKNELGGSAIHTRNGAVDDEVDSEAEAFAAARRFLSYLPSSVHELAPRLEPEDDPNRRVDWLIDAVPRDARKVYKMRPIVEAVVDQGSFFEIGRKWGRSVITGLARLDGWPVAVLASDPMHYGGAWTADASQKVMRFVDLAETFQLPVVHLVDIPGFLIGPQAEQQATIRHGVRAMTAVFQATVPWCAMLVRKVYGVAGAAHQNSSRFSMRYAWPSGDWGSLPIAGGLEAAYKAELEAAEDPAAKLAEIEARLNRLRSPFRTAESFMVEEIIDPRDTRPLLCEFANLAAPLREPRRPSFGLRP